ncbi:MAG: bifunctional adenosylcobinamide kinase/adenosylcobinamide-phosphate guanylyltransferase [Roseburia sp.]|nr:bifunctional adenosylcobinamide kinase/adenosylcobinamide-phosphate guanylyltransferase [Roseburia sp.]
MMVLVTGGSGSGKSAYAEETVLRLAKEKTRYYIATMQVFDDEGEKKIKRHQKLRAGKGFQTIEQPMHIGQAADKIKKDSVVLIECMSNLVANEMFSPVEEEAATSTYEGDNLQENSGFKANCNRVMQEVVSGIDKIRENCEHLVIVTNNVFEDGIRYDDSTMAYMKVLGAINEKLAAESNQVIEVVAGIPIMGKDER